MVRWANIWLTATGVFVFGALFWFVHASPDRFDRAIGNVVVSEVGDRLHAALPSLLGENDVGASLIDEVATRLPGQLGERVAAEVSAVEFLSKPDAEEIAQRVLAEVCECQRVEETVPPDLGPVLADVLADTQVDLVRIEEQIRAFALGEYHAALSKLRRDVSIFAGTTLALFLAALLLGVFKGRASKHLLPISLVLTSATLLTGYWYVFGQDWIMTVVLSDYWGMAYPVFAAAVAAFPIDIALFRARVTTVLLNAVGAVAVPC